MSIGKMIVVGLGSLAIQMAIIALVNASNQRRGGRHVDWGYALTMGFFGALGAILLEGFVVIAIMTW